MTCKDSDREGDVRIQRQGGRTVGRATGRERRGS